jgi:hypothetical protein
MSCSPRVCHDDKLGMGIIQFIEMLHPIQVNDAILGGLVAILTVPIGADSEELVCDLVHYSGWFFH